MITKNNAVLRIIGVEHLQWKEGVFEVAPRDFSVLAFRVCGSAEIQSGNELHKLGTNDILYLPQGMSYRAKYTDTELVAIHFKTLRQDKQIMVHPLQDSMRFHRLFFKAQELWKNKEPGYATFAMEQLFGILGAMEEEAAKNNLPKHFRKAVSFINAHFTEPQLSSEMICSQSGISATSFRQLFKKHYGQTPTEYITLLRLEYARKRISGDATVEQAALESGFSDPKYFARVVKKHYGCTPRGLKNYGK